MRRCLGVLVVMSAVFVTAGCGKSEGDAGPTPGVSTTMFTVPGDPDSTIPTSSTTPSTSPDPEATTTTELPFTGGSITPQSGPPVGGRLALLSSLRIAAHRGFDRVVFEFENDALPFWSVKYVQPPFTADPSGAPLPVAGTAFLAVGMVSGSGFDPDTLTSTYEGSGEVSGGAGTKRVTEVVRTGDFEAQMGWIIGLEGVAKFKVTPLAKPSRLVVDITWN